MALHTQKLFTIIKMTLLAKIHTANNFQIFMSFTEYDWSITVYLGQTILQGVHVLLFVYTYYS